jgi:hypothetical protein
MKPAKRTKYGAMGRLLAHVVLRDLRRSAICFCLRHPLFHPNLNHEIVAVKIIVHRALPSDGFRVTYVRDV